jgi:hypothetical protein
VIVAENQLRGVMTRRDGQKKEGSSWSFARSLEAGANLAGNTAED